MSSDSDSEYTTATDTEDDDDDNAEEEEEASLPQIGVYRRDRSLLVMGRRLGGGAFGGVYEATLSGVPVAVKKLERLVDAEMLEKECATMCKCRDKHVVTWKGWCEGDRGDKWIIMEFIEGGDVHERIHHTDLEVRPDFKRRMEIARDTAYGLNELHAQSPPIIHLDLKPPNLVIDQYQVVKVADFGLAREYQQNEPYNHIVGTLPYCAPEIMAGDDDALHPKADVYSFGILLWELFTSVIPWSGIQDIMVNVKAGKRPEIPPECPAKLKELIEVCWHQDKTQRPSFFDIITQRKIDDIIMEDVLDGNTKAVGLWKMFCGKKLVESVPWETFALALKMYYSAKQTLDNDLFLQLRALIGSKGQVSLTDFSHLAPFLDEGEDPLATLQDMIGIRCFYLDMKETHVTGADMPGTFCVRLSRKQKRSLTITVVAFTTAGAMVQGHPVKRLENGQFSFRNYTSPKLSAVIHKFSSDLQLNTPQINTKLLRPTSVATMYNEDAPSAPAARTYDYSNPTVPVHGTQYAQSTILPASTSVPPTHSVKHSAPASQSKPATYVPPAQTNSPAIHSSGLPAMLTGPVLSMPKQECSAKKRLPFMKKTDESLLTVSKEQKKQDSERLKRAKAVEKAKEKTLKQKKPKHARSVKARVDSKISVLKKNTARADKLLHPITRLADLAKKIKYAKYIFKRNGVSLVATIMDKYPDNTKLMEQSCYLYFHLANLDDTYETKVGQQGGVQALTNVISKNPRCETVIPVAFAALQSLTASSDENRKLAVDGGAIVGVITAVTQQKRNPQTNELACGVFANLAFNNEPNKVAMERSKVVQIILLAQSSFIDRELLQENACTALFNLAFTSMEVRRQILDNRGIETLISMMGKYPNNITIQESACGTLAQLSVEELATQTNGRDIVMNALINCPRSGEVKFWSRIVLDKWLKH
eukprot:TRINITY_DN172_c0_g2_i6.p1 TRINITY_DN172_c0_g2~~TRINITY_DN172_c0_g2_i6.p1  ORF type:complete len:933 (-),score=149.81 TRINITY_DN172_c0_g2_i6:112-2910(-)